MRRHSFDRGDAIAVLLAVASLLTVGEARAYCRSTTCKDCPRDEDGCKIGGTELAWPGRCVGLGVHDAASEQVDLATVEMLTERAFETWNAIRCGPDGLPASIELVGTGGPIMCGRSEFIGDSANANVLIFRDEEWPYEGSGSEVATTTVRSRNHGEIVDADIEINGTRPLLVGDGEGQGTIVGAHDLLSVLTHEMGHLLGLDHSSDPDSIMQITLPPRAVRTTLGDDDVVAICAAYPPERDAAPCDPTPHGEFSAQCALDPSTGGACSAVRPGAWSERAAGGSVWLLVLLLTLSARLRSRRARAPGDRARQSRSLPRMPCFQSRR